MKIGPYGLEYVLKLLTWMILVHNDLTKDPTSRNFLYIKVHTKPCSATREYKIFQIGYSVYRNFVVMRFILWTKDVIILQAYVKITLKFELPSALASLQKRDSLQIKYSQINLTKIRDLPS